MTDRGFEKFADFTEPRNKENKLSRFFIDDEIVGTIDPDNFDPLDECSKYADADGVEPENLVVVGVEERSATYIRTFNGTFRY